MGREAKAILISTILIGAAVVIQSTVLRWVAIRGVRPDLGLIILVFISIRKGSMVA